MPSLIAATFTRTHTFKMPHRKQDYLAFGFEKGFELKL
jgi:hypothetical protein